VYNDDEGYCTVRVWNNNEYRKVENKAERCEKEYIRCKGIWYD